MAAVEQQAPPAAARDPVIVGNAFVTQYYHILYKSRELVHRFYQDISKVGRPEENGVMSISTTLHAINKKILSLDYGNFGVAEITSVDSQESFNGGVLVQVNGYFTGKDNLKRKFTQTFFLAPQENGYFVLNDIFRFVDEPENQDGKAISGNGAAAPPPHQDPVPAPVQDNHISEEPTLPENTGGEEVYDPPESGDISAVEEEAPVPEVINEEAPVPEVISEEVSVAEVVNGSPDDSVKIAESNSRSEDVPKKSYASILKVMKEKAASMANPAPPPKPVSKSQDQQVAPAPAPAPASAPASAAVTETNVSAINVTENGNNQDAEAEGPSIYVKGLPPTATPVMLENEFKKFGTIRSDGIQVKSQRGFAFGFVEFEEPDAVQRAIEASPIMIGGRKAVVEEKRSTFRANKGRSSAGPGSGYRNEAVRGRGNYGGGRGYGRGEYSNRNDYGNRGSYRGGYSSRGGDGRMNRAGGVTVNTAAKAMAPRVPATA